MSVDEIRQRRLSVNATRQANRISCRLHRLHRRSDQRIEDRATVTGSQDRVVLGVTATIVPTAKDNDVELRSKTTAQGIGQRCPCTLHRPWR